MRLTAHAVKLGCAGALMLPPFYYKGVSDEGLYRNYAEIVERAHLDRVEHLVADQLDSLGNRGPVIPGLFPRRDRVDAEQVADHRRLA